MFEKILKRNGEIAAFDRVKIDDAIFKAFVITRENRSRKELRKLAEVITDYVLDKMVNQDGVKGVPHVEDIQDVVEEMLMKMGEFETAKNYIKVPLST